MVANTTTQAFKHYTHAPLLDVIRSERDATGIFGFYCAGIPAWAASSMLAIARENPLKRIFVVIRDYVLGFTGGGNLTLSIRALFGLAYTASVSRIHTHKPILKVLMIIIVHEAECLSFLSRHTCIRCFKRSPYSLQTRLLASDSSYHLALNLSSDCLRFPPAFPFLLLVAFCSSS